ncbi:hypothetical protein P167DRAFT_357144 [Morchella conica CCBAS932]|uniref:Uncharacterized protein n=1 Tax=Morchella conica CCBAS932 TaxID=1392247 RepID=A0A3N4KD23_9PEZI|nr:hypothetical protein P167DRAFT_357144 [Morchella conica CCBAS932]
MTPTRKFHVSSTSAHQQHNAQSPPHTYTTLNSRLSRPETFFGLIFSPSVQVAHPYSDTAPFLAAVGVAAGVLAMLFGYMWVLAIRPAYCQGFGYRWGEVCWGRWTSGAGEWVQCEKVLVGHEVSLGRGLPLVWLKKDFLCIA